MGKKLRKIDRDIDVSWKKLGIGYNEDRRDIWVEIHDELGFVYKFRVTKNRREGLLISCLTVLTH